MCGVLNQTIIGYLQISLAMFIVGSSVVAGKLVIQSFPLFLASELRFLLASLILIPLLIIVEGIPSINRKDCFFIFLQALCGVFLFNIFLLYGLTFTSALEAGIITSTLPAIMVCLSFLFFKEKITKRTGLALLFVIVGTLAINLPTTNPSFTQNSARWLGNLLILLAVIGEALFLILGKVVEKRVSPLTVSTLVSLFGAVLFFPFAIFQAKDFSFQSVNMTDWLLICYLSIVVTILGFIFMYAGLKKVSTNNASVLTGILPISSSILSSIILAEHITFIHVFGISLILLAIYFISIKNKHPL